MSDFSSYKNLIVNNASIGRNLLNNIGTFS